ncbi:hypothetical protein ACIQM3_07355 [Streptomyces sp. NPDC091271]|uniref:hypothetical protein n=1 Tax=Streptomyces sp. NPDC091271 TaxID=3365980 RepID=UPI00382FC484
MREPHPSAGAATIGIPRPQAAKEIRGRFISSVIGAGATWAVLGVCLPLEPSIAAHADGPFFGGVVIAAVTLTTAATQIASARYPGCTVALVGDTALAELILAGAGGLATGNAAVIIATVALQGGAYKLALRHRTAHLPAERHGAVMSGHRRNRLERHRDLPRLLRARGPPLPLRRSGRAGAGARERHPEATSTPRTDVGGGVSRIH